MAAQDLHDMLSGNILEYPEQHSEHTVCIHPASHVTDALIYNCDSYGALEKLKFVEAGIIFYEHIKAKHIIAYTYTTENLL